MANLTLQGACGGDARTGTTDSGVPDDLGALADSALDAGSDSGAPDDASMPDGGNASDATTGSPGALVVVGPTSLAVTEGGSTATFTVQLSSMPTAAVVVPLSTSDGTEASLDVTSLMFDGTTWNVPRTVTVTGLDDALRDGSQSFQVQFGSASSTDLRFDGISATPIDGTNADDDTPGFIVSVVDGSATEGGDTATVSIRLATAPAYTVSVGASVSVPAKASVSTGLLVFTSTNWSMPRVLTIVRTDDQVADGNLDVVVQFGAAVSADLDYQGLDAPDATVSTVDDDAAGIAVSGDGLTLVDSVGSTRTVRVALTSMPSGDVTVTSTVSDGSIAAVSPTTLVFTASNWSTPQDLTVSAVKVDSIDDADAPFVLTLQATSTADVAYATLAPHPVAMVVLDDDGAGLLIAGPSLRNAACGSFDGSLETWEGLRDDTFTVRLCTAPTADVVVTLDVSDATEASVTPVMLTFTASNWSVPQVVTVDGLDDLTTDGDQVFVVTASVGSLDPGYGVLRPASIPGTNFEYVDASLTATTSVVAPACTYSVTSLCANVCILASCRTWGSAALLHDGSLTTGFGYSGFGDPTTPPAHLLVDLGGVRSVAAVRLACAGGSSSTFTPHTLQIRASTADPWTDVYTTTTATVEEVRIAASVAQLRVVGAYGGGGSGYTTWDLGCMEFGVYTSP